MTHIVVYEAEGVRCLLCEAKEQYEYDIPPQLDKCERHGLALSAPVKQTRSSSYQGVPSLEMRCPEGCLYLVSHLKRHPLLGDCPKRDLLKKFLQACDTVSSRVHGYASPRGLYPDTISAEDWRAFMSDLKTVVETGLLLDRLNSEGLAAVAKLAREAEERRS